METEMPDNSHAHPIIAPALNAHHGATVAAAPPARQRTTAEICRALLDARAAHQAILDEITPAFDGRCTELGWLVLCALRSGHRPAMQLAEEVGIRPSSLSRTLSDLERAGFARRDRQHDDARIVQVSITTEGVRLLDAIALRADALWCAKQSREQIAELGRAMEG
jgi:DNA-binding MarR family transcriptional regulator